jgi:sphingomyelin phosphodiesterase
MWVLLNLLLACGFRIESIECEACRKLVQDVQDYSLMPEHWAEGINIGIDICESYFHYTKEVCVGAVDEDSAPAINGFIRRFIDPDHVCKEIDLCSTPNYVPENFTEWVNAVMSDKPPGPPPVPTGKSSYKFAQMSDIHVDMFYQNGTVTDCDLPVCCRTGVGNAGQWGDYNCDLPVSTFEAALVQLKTLDPDFIIITGDMPPHDIWNQSDSYNMAYQTLASGLLKKYFPDTPVYAIYGNHACFPVNQFDYENNSEQWLLDGFAENWGFWLTSDAVASIKQRGTYSMLHPGTNLRLISLDTQACNNGNFYLWINNTDPFGQVQWLRQQLSAAEKNGEVVYLFGHFYLADDGCVKYWSYHIDALIDRYESIISGMFFGHSHSDEFHINRGVYNNKPTRIQFVSPSITTYTNKNPSFRIYEADTDTKLVTDYTQYRLNLTKANENPESLPLYDIAYTFKSQYNVTNLNPSTLYRLALQMGNNERLALTYINNRNTGVDPSNSCDAQCLSSLLCDLTYGVGDQIDLCQGTEPTGFDADLNDLLFPPWTYKEW